MNSPQPLLSSGLPTRFVQLVSRAFEHLDCSQPPVSALVHVFGRFVEKRGLLDSAAIQRIFSLLIAAIHAHTRMTEPAPPMATNPPTNIPSPSEWLLLAARERACGALPHAIGEAVDVLIACIDGLVETNHHASSSSPPHDYGLGELLAAVESEIPHDSARAAGQALGKLARLTLEVLVLTRASGPLCEPVLLRAVVEAPELVARLDLALALACKPVPDKLALLSFLGHRDVRSRLIAVTDAWVEVAVRETGGIDFGPDFIPSTRNALTQKLDSLRIFGFAKPPALAGELERTITLAVDALGADPELRESWEVQRWGGPFPNTCIGKFFPMGLCTLALVEAGVDQAARGSELLAMCGVDGFRYFEGYSGIAPDADDLGLALQLMARLPDPTRHMEALTWPVEVLVRNTLPDGEIPVWLERHLREPRAEDAPQWRGSRCLAVAANAVIGLLEARVTLPAGYLDRAIEWITNTWRTDGLRAVFFYGLSYARMVIVRLADVAEGRTEDPATHQKLRAIAFEIEDEILASVRRDGGFGGIMDTACHLAALAFGRRTRFDPWPSIAFLASRQEHDGFWAAEPLYPTPGKDYAAGAHGARSITTALCLYALSRARRRLYAGITSDSQAARVVTS